MRFKDETVMITGAGGGIGRAYALAFAAEGARIAATDIDVDGAAETVEKIAEAGGRAEAFKLDVGIEDAVADVVERIVGSLGDVDILINNAGIAYGDIYSLVSIDAPRLQQVMSVNVFGMLYCARQCRPSMAKRGGGVIVNKSSMASYMANGAYGLSKAAVNNLTLALADELAGDNIRVNGIAPGLMGSPAAMQNVDGHFQQLIRNAQLVKRPGTMDDVTALAMFLCSDEASFINGQTILVDGGFLRHSAGAVPVPL